MYINNVKYLTEQKMYFFEILVAIIFPKIKFFNHIF